MKILQNAPAKSSMFVTFDRIIKDPDFFILDEIIRNIDLYGEYFDLENLKLIPPDVRYGMIISRREKNLFEWLLKKDCDYQTSYDLMYQNEKTLYIESPFLNMANTLLELSKSYLIEEIYIWNEVFDKRQSFEISSMYSSLLQKNITYVTGEYNSVINALPKLRIIFDYDIDRLQPLLESRDDIIFGLANYGFNYILEEDHYVLKHNGVQYKNLGTFEVYHAKDKQFFG